MPRISLGLERCSQEGVSGKSETNDSKLIHGSKPVLLETAFQFVFFSVLLSFPLTAFHEDLLSLENSLFFILLKTAL